LLRKNVSGIMLTLLLIGMLTLAFNIQPVKADPKTWTVDDDGPADFHTIQEAINAASLGDTIYVHNGTYSEHIVVNKNDLTFFGENKNATIIDGGESGTVVQIIANGSKINGFTIRRGGPTWFGIRFDHSSHNRLIDCNIINNYGSIDLYYSSNNTLSNNNVTRNYDGIHLSDAFNNTISDNNIASNIDYGIHLWYSFDNVVFGNNVTNNYWYGIYLGNSSNNTLFGNTIASNGEDGMCLEMSSSYNIMLDNTIRNNNGGIWLSPSSNNIISGNNITANNFGGIYLYYSSNNNSINGNNIANNDFGVLVYNSLSNAINGNNITANNRYAVALYSYSKNNIVNTNNITCNGEGIYLEGSSSNIIYHNNFINNSKQASPYYSVNIWDDGYPSGGNYWSDYSGVDLKWGSDQHKSGSDGIGDTAYVIDTNNRDRYPLMKPWAPSLPKGPCDLNGDGKVDIYDVVLACVAYGSKEGYPNWNPLADLAPPYGIINIYDIVTIAVNCGKTYP